MLVIEIKTLSVVPTVGQKISLNCDGLFQRPLVIISDIKENSFALRVIKG
jgi:hypothetical protein